jgi:hypothetical protein
MEFVFYIRGWGYVLYVAVLVGAFLCGYYYRTWEEGRREARELAERVVGSACPKCGEPSSRYRALVGPTTE